MEVVSNNLNVNLLETDDSFIWTETQVTSLFQTVMNDPWILDGNFKASKGWDRIYYPWY